MNTFTATGKATIYHYLCRKNPWKMKSFTLLLSVLILTTALHSCNEKTTESKPVIMAYYVAPRDHYEPQNLPLEKLTHIIFSFTEVIDNEMKFVRESSKEKLQLLSAQKRNHPHLKVMIACGGWGGSGDFSDMAVDPATRKKFVDSAIKFLQDYNLDGIDIDWEYPGLKGAGNPYRPEDKQNFTSLMKELREAMDATGKKLVLTFASAGWERYYDHIETLEVMKYANYMNVMTYDLVGGYATYTGHHTNLGWITREDLQGTPAYEAAIERGVEPEPRSAEKIVDYCVNLGVDPGQIVIGAAFYGRAWKEVPPANHGLYQKAATWIPWCEYGKIRTDFEHEASFTRYWDPAAKAPYLYNSTDSLFISYDDPESVALKTKYAKERGLGGIMFWELSNDTEEDNSLLDAIYNEMQNN